MYRERDFVIKDKQWAITCSSLDYTVSQHYHINMSVALQREKYGLSFYFKGYNESCRGQKTLMGKLIILSVPASVIVKQMKYRRRQMEI